MTTLTAPLGERPARGLPDTRLLVLAVIVGVLALQAELVLAKSINWDEFWHYSLITASARGEEVPFLQTPFIPLFGWLTATSLAPIDQIVVMRGFILGFEGVACAALYAAARNFASSRVSLIVVLVYLTAGYVFLHGFALRADMIAAALLMTALALSLGPRITPATGLAIAALLVLALLATIKSVLWAPAFLAVVVLRAGDMAPPRKAQAAVAALTVAAGAGFFAFGGEAVASAARTIALAGERMLSGGLFPQGRYLVIQVLIAPVFSALLAVFAWWLAMGAAPSRCKWAFALFAAPLLSVLFYRNAFPYYFAFILPPVALALVPAIEIVLRRYGALAVLCVLSACVVALSFGQERQVMAVQRQFQSELRAVFSEPVIYIDECGIIGDYPRAVLQFASGWSLDRYHTEGDPLYHQRLMRDTVPLLVANSDALQNVFHPDRPGPRLLPEDEATLRANFVPHGGMIHVAGKRLSAGQVLTGELVAVPGRYRVEGSAVTIDGAVHPPGTVVTLARRAYHLANPSARSAILRWAAAGNPVPSTATLANHYTNY